MITLVIGPCGSGKTYYVKNSLQYDIFIDDPTNMANLPEKFSGHLVIADPWLCISWKTATEKLKEKYPNEEIKYIFFENNYEKCKNNVDKRAKLGDNRKVDVSLKIICSNYTIPDGVTIKEVYND